MAPAERAPAGAPPTGSLFAGKPPRSRRRATRLRRALYAAAAPLVDLAARALWASLRVELAGEERARDLARAPGAAIPCVWHRDLVLGAWALRRLARSGLRPGALISPSLDGEVPAKVARRWGVAVVRGSSTRTGVRALRDLMRVVRAERVSPLTAPDGPSGPERRFQPGAAMLAQLSGAPVLPIGVAHGASLRLPTWDGMRLPLPFTRVAVVLGPPRAVPRDLPPDALPAEAEAMGRALDAARTAAEALRRGAPA